MRSHFYLRYFAALLLTAGAWAQEPAPETPKPTTEAGWIAQLGQGATFAERHEACRALRQVGTDHAVPALAALLGDPELGSWARYALESIPASSADTALLSALDDTDGDLKAGIVTTLGVRRVAEAVPQLRELLGHDNQAVAEASAGSLGRIASAEAVAALRQLDTPPDSNLGVAVAEALLAAAEARKREGDIPAAMAIYEALRDPAQTQPVRFGALRGLVHISPENAPAMIVEALKSGDAKTRDFAAQLVAETTGDDGTDAFAEALPTLSVAGQATLLRGLATRGDSLARPAILDALDHSDSSVQIAAVEALGQLGRAEDVPTMASLLVSDNETLARAAAQSLRQLDHEGFEAAVATETRNQTDPGTHIALLGVLADRLAADAIPIAVNDLGNENTDVRNAALDTLLRMGTEEQFDVVAATLRDAPKKEERNLAGRVLAVLCKRGGNTMLPQLAAAMGDATPEARAVMVRCFDDVGTAEALAAMMPNLASEEQVVRDATADVLGGWPAMDAASHLLALAKEKDGDYQDLGFNGYVRLANLEGDPNLKADMLDLAMPLATERQQQWKVLSAWGSLHTPRALEAVLPHLQQDDIRNEAGAAIIGIAGEVAKQTEHREAAIAALKEVVAATRNSIKDRAQDLLNTLEQPVEQS